MSKEATKFWFVGYSASPKRIFYLFQADSMYSAKERLKDVKGVGAVYQITWDKLNKLVGAVIPDDVDKDSASFGLLVFRYADCFVKFIA